MNLRYLHYLRLVVDHGSFAAAARAAGVSQPAISHGLRMLQRGFDAPLFTQAGRNKIPTETALRASLQTHGIEQGLAALSQPRAASADRDILRVGMTAAGLRLFGPTIDATWRQVSERRQLHVSTADEGHMLTALQGGGLDLVVAPLPRGFQPTGVSRHLLYLSAPVVCARRGHPLGAARSLEELQGAAWAIVGPSVSGPVNVLQEAHAVRRLPPPRVAVTCPDYAALLQLVAHSDLLCVITHGALLDGVPGGLLKPIRIREALPRYEVHLFAPARPRRALQPVMAALKALASTVNPPDNPMNLPKFQ